MLFQAFTEQQLYVIGWSCLLGTMLGAFYDLFRVFRLIFSKGWVSVIIQDIIFWCVAGLATFAHILAINKGQVRLYILLSILLGFMIYYYTMGRLIFKTVSAAANGIKRMIAGAAAAAGRSIKRLKNRIKRKNAAKIVQKSKNNSTKTDKTP